MGLQHKNRPPAHTNPYLNAAKAIRRRRTINLDKEIVDITRRTGDEDPTPKEKPSLMKNKLRRQELVEARRVRLAMVKKELRHRKAVLCTEKGMPMKKQVPLSLDLKRDYDATLDAHKKIESAAEDLVHAETLDEFQGHLDGRRAVSVAITTSVRPRGKDTITFATDLVDIFGGAMRYVARGDLAIKPLIARCIQEGYTSLLVLHEDRRQLTHLLTIALPSGPSAWFRLTEVCTRKNLVGAGKPLTGVPPEVILNNFRTRLGRRIGRMLQTNLNAAENLRARQVVTFHNQRDFIFFRAHRYIFEHKNPKDPSSEVAARLHELGPQFTLKLKWLQQGLYDHHNRDYEFYYRSEMDSHSRTKFFL